MTPRLMIINGPNLNYLGIREPHIYGHTTLPVLESECRKFADHLGIELAFHQSNFEGAIVELIQSGRESADALIINPAGYSFTSIAIIDAMKIFEKLIIELHVSNIHARDDCTGIRYCRVLRLLSFADWVSMATSWPCRRICRR